MMGAIDRLERDHMHSEKAVRDLLHLLLAWEQVGAARKSAFVDALGPYIEAYLEHMRLEETLVLPAAEAALLEEDWVALDLAFDQNADPLTGKYPLAPRLKSSLVVSCRLHLRPLVWAKRISLRNGCVAPTIRGIARKPEHDVPRCVCGLNKISCLKIFAFRHRCG